MGEKDFRVRKGLVVDGTGTSSIAGSLGIGTTSPTANLDVHGTILANPTGTYSATVGSGSDTSTTAGLVLDGDADIFREANGYLRRVIGASSATLTIGQDSTSIWNTIDLIPGHSGKIRLYSDNSDSSTNSAELTMTIDDAKVGIGTASPDQKLHVEGSILADAYNFATTTLASNYTDGDTSLVLTSSAQFAAAGSGTINGTEFTWTANDTSTNTLTVPDLDASYTAGVTVVADTGLFFRDGFENVAQPSVTIYDKDNSGASRDDLSINANAGIRFRLGNESQMQLTADQLSLTTGNQGAAAIFGFRDRNDMGMRSNTTYSVGVIAPDNVFIQTDSNNNGSSNYIDFGHGSKVIGSAESMMRIVMGGATGPGKVGIGTTSPGTSLHLSDAEQVTLSVDSSNSIGAQISLDATATGGNEWRLVSAADGASADAGAFGLYNIDTSAYRLVVKADGNVGIGTTSPSTELHVSGASHPSIRVTGTDNAGADPAIELLGTADNFTEGGQLWYDNGTGVLHLASLYNNAAADIQFHTRTGADRSTSNVRMAIEGDGNVGIGTTSPDSLLHVLGTDAILTVEDSSIGVSALSRTMAGIDLISAGMNASSSKYGTALKFLSDDSQLTTENPKFLAAIVPRATETYSADTDGGMALDFAVTDNNPGTTNVPSVAMTVDHTGSVGIGTTSPDGLLELSTGDGFALLGGADLSATSQTDDTRKFFRMGMPHYDTDEEPFSLISGDADNGNNKIFIGGGTGLGNAANFIFFNTASDSTTTTGSTRMTIKGDGKVGIGDTNPIALLHLEFAGGDTTTFANTNETYRNMILLRNNTVTTDAFAGIAFDVSTESDFDSIGASIAAVRDTSAGTTAGNHDANLAFSTNDAGDDGNTERMRITHDGKVGIGTTSPAFPLEVDGFISTASGIVHTGDTNNTITFGTDTQSFNTDSNTRMHITSTGRVGIGTTSPSVPLEVNGEIKGSKINLTAGTDAFTIQSSSPLREKKIYATTSGDGSPFDEMVFHSEGSTGGWSGQHTFTVSKSEDDDPDVFSPYTAFRIRDSGNGTTSEVLVSHKLGVGILDPVPMLHIYGNNSTTNQTTSGAASITIEQDGAGDAALNFLLTGTRRWIMGIDNSLSDKFVVSTGGTDLNTGAKLSIDTSGNLTMAGGVNGTSASFSNTLSVSNTATINGSHSFVNATAITQNGVAINGTNFTKCLAATNTFAFSNSYLLVSSLTDGSEMELFRFNVTNSSYRKFQAGKMYIRVQDTATNGFFQQTVTFGDTGGDVFSSATDRLDSSMGGVQAAWNDEKATIVVSKVSDYICVKFRNDTNSTIATGGFSARVSVELFEMDAMPS